MKTEKEYLIDAYLLLIIQMIIGLLIEFTGNTLLGLVGFIVQVVAIKKLIRNAIDPSEFKMSRYAIWISILAMSIAIIYTLQIVSGYVIENVDPILIINENRGIYLSIFIASTIARSIAYFITQGSKDICDNEIQNPTLANQFDKFKYFILAFIVLDIISIFVIDVVILIPILGIAYALILLYLFWKIRSELIISLNQR